jgi:hypothetical protein
VLGALLFGLLLTVVIGLRDCVHVVLIPEEDRITTMGLDVVGYWTVRGWVFAAEHHACALACVEVPKEDPLA